MAMTSYNSYRITPGKWAPYNSDDLRAMKIADAQIEAEFAARAHPVPVVLEATETDPRAKKREYNRRYSEAHRDRIRAQKREYNRRYDAAHHQERVAYHARYWQMNKDIICDRQRERRAEKAAHQEGESA
jgi:hypothetical protein